MIETLNEVAARGYITDEWSRWQQGQCLAYAVGLIQLYPSLQLGTLYVDDVEVHHFAHDDRFAYDSAGRHKLPYLGIDGTAEMASLDEDPEWYDAPAVEDVQAATAHARRHGVGPA